MRAVFKGIKAISALIILVIIISIGFAIYSAVTADAFSTEFVLTEQDFADFKKSAEKFEASAIGGKGDFIVAFHSNQFMLGYQWIDTQATIAYLHYCEDTSDEDAVSDYEFAFSMRYDANQLYNETLKNILLADNEYSKMLFEGWSDEDKEQLLKNNGTVYELMERNEEIVLEYHSLDDESEGWLLAVDTLYEELVDNYNAIAREYGYDNYYDYASASVQRRDYGEEDINEFRSMVKEYILPLYLENRAKIVGLKESFSEQTLEEYRKIVKSCYGTCDETVEYFTGYKASFSEEISFGMERMFSENASFFANNENALPTAYTTLLSFYNEPIAYFGPGYQDILTVVHENGHYLAFLEEEALLQPLDIHEVHSQANEWLFVAYLEGCMSEEVYEVLLLERVVSGLGNIILATAVDECEMAVYNQPSELGKEEHADIIAEIADSYGEVGELLGLDVYFRYVALSSPVYYLSYATSEMASMALYTVADDDYALAQEIYSSLILEMDEFDGFKEAMNHCGFLDPFSEDTFRFISEEFAVQKDGVR